MPEVGLEPAGFRIENVSNMVARAIIQGYKEICKGPFMLLFIIPISIISFEHKYLFQVEQKLYCMRTYQIPFIFPMLFCNKLCNKNTPL